MIRTMPKVDKKARYAAVDVVNILQISRATLRRYVQRGYIPFELNISGRKIFKGNDVLHLWNAIL